MNTRTIRLLLLTTLVSFSLISCKSKQKIADITGANVPATVAVTTPEPAPAPVQQTTPAQPEVTRSESFKLASGETNADALKYKYHVVVGSFGNHDNARNLRAKLVTQGNSSFVAENESGMLRVIIASFNDYNAAHAKINQIKATYADAWVLVQK